MTTFFPLHLVRACLKYAAANAARTKIIRKIHAASYRPTPEEAASTTMQMHDLGCTCGVYSGYQQIKGNHYGAA